MLKQDIVTNKKKKQVLFQILQKNVIDQTISNKITILKYIDELNGFSAQDHSMVLYRLRLLFFELKCLLQTWNFKNYFLYLLLSGITFAYQFEGFYCLFLF